MDDFVRAKHDRVLSLPLAEAAARTFYRVTGRVVPKEPITRERVLSSVAHALTNVVPIYVRPGPGLPPRRVTPCELLLSEFSEGATVLTLAGGVQLRVLTVQLRDLTDAVTVLRTVKAWFPIQRPTERLSGLPVESGGGTR